MRAVEFRDFREEPLEVGPRVRTVAKEHVLAVLDTRDDHVRARGGQPALHEAEPEIPVLEVTKLLIEAARLVEHVPTHDDVGAASGHVVAPEEQLGQLGVQRRVERRRVRRRGRRRFLTGPVSRFHFRPTWTWSRPGFRVNSMRRCHLRARPTAFPPDFVDNWLFG